MYTDSNQHTLEPELTRPAPRNARFTSMTQFTRGLMLTIWIGLTIGLFYGAYQDIDRLHRLLTSGKTMYATVVDKYVHHGKSTSYHITYQYAVDGRYYGNSDTVPSDYYYQAQIGSTLLITYLPQDPSIDRIGIVDQPLIQTHTQNWVIGIGLACTIVGIIVAIIEGGYKKRLFLMTWGTPALGRVTSKDQQSNGKTTTYKVSYAFTADGQPMWNTVSVQSRFYDSVYPGTYITVLHAPGNPKDSLPYRAITEIVCPV